MKLVPIALALLLACGCARHEAPDSTAAPDTISTEAHTPEPRSKAPQFGSPGVSPDSVPRAPQGKERGESTSGRQRAHRVAAHSPSIEAAPDPYGPDPITGEHEIPLDEVFPVAPEAFDLTECAWTPPVGAPPPPGRARVGGFIPCDTLGTYQVCNGDTFPTSPSRVRWMEVWGRRCCDICPRRLTWARVSPCRQKTLTWDPGTDVYDMVYVILTDEAGNSCPCSPVLNQPRWIGDLP